jgi:uncharacterized protein
MPVHVGVVRVELHVPGARSLKDKRRVVRSLIERMHHRVRVSVAETGLHDLHQRAEIALAVVAGSEAELAHLLDQLHRLAEETGDAFLTRWEPLSGMGEQPQLYAELGEKEW